MWNEAIGKHTDQFEHISQLPSSKTKEIIANDKNPELGSASCLHSHIVPLPPHTFLMSTLGTGGPRNTYQSSPRINNYSCRTVVLPAIHPATLLNNPFTALVCRASGCESAADMKYGTHHCAVAVAARDGEGRQVVRHGVHLRPGGQQQPHHLPGRRRFETPRRGRLGLLGACPAWGMDWPKVNSSSNDVGGGSQHRRPLKKNCGKNCGKIILGLYTLLLQGT